MSSLINSLNDDCILLIFNRFSLHMQITVFRLVCKRWHEVISNKCHSRITLKLFPNNVSLVKYRQTLLDSSMQCYPEHFEPRSDAELVLPVRYFEKKTGLGRMVEVITRQLFPRVEKLIVCSFATNTSVLVNMLDTFLDEHFSGWNSGLVSLAIFGCCTAHGGTAHVWKRIEELPVLRSLHLVGVHLNLIDPKYLPTTRLQQLTLCYEDLFCLSKWRHVYAELKQLKHFVLVGPSSTFFDDILNPSWENSLLHLGLNMVGPQMLKTICTRFKNLVSLDVRITEKVLLSDLMSNLALLPRLISLRLIGLTRSQIKFDSKNRFEEMPQVNRSITMLYLKSSVPIHELDILITTLFPRLEQLYLICPSNSQITRRITKWIRGQMNGSKRLSFMLNPRQIALCSSNDVSRFMSRSTASRYFLGMLVDMFKNAQKEAKAILDIAIQAHHYHMITNTIDPKDRCSLYDQDGWKYESFYQTQLWVEEEKLKRELNSS